MPKAFGIAHFSTLRACGPRLSACRQGPAGEAQARNLAPWQMMLGLIYRRSKRTRAAPTEVLFRPAQLCWGAPAFEEILQRVRLVRPVAASAPGEGRKVDQASQDPEAEAVQHIVGIVDPPARTCHEEPHSLPNAVAVHGEGLAGGISSLRRPGEDATRVA